MALYCEKCLLKLKIKIIKNLKCIDNRHFQRRWHYRGINFGQRIANDVNKNEATLCFENLLRRGGNGECVMTPYEVLKLWVFSIVFAKLSVLCSSMGIGVQSKSIPEDLGRTYKVVEDLISKDDIVIFSKTYCPYCKMAKETFDALNQTYTVIELDQREDGSAIQTVLGQITGAKTVPRVFLRGKCIGGGNEVKALFESGHLINMLQ